MPGQTGTAPATSDPRTVGLRIGLAIGAVGTLLLLLGVGTALMPNQRTALYLFTGGSVALTVGGSAVYRSSRRRGSLTHPPKD